MDDLNDLLLGEDEDSEDLDEDLDDADDDADSDEEEN